MNGRNERPYVIGEASSTPTLLGETLQSDRCSKGDSPLSGRADGRFIDRTLELWHQRSTRPLTRENARQIMVNATDPRVGGRREK